MKHRIPTLANIAAAAFQDEWRYAEQAAKDKGTKKAPQAETLTAGTLMTRANQAQVRAANGL